MALSEVELQLNRQMMSAEIIDAIEGKRHENYERVEDLAELYMKLVTGKDINSLMSQFVRRESEAEFEQRCRITQHITSVICQGLMTPAYKIPRSNAANRVLTYGNNNESGKLQELESVLSKFWGDKDVDEWLSTRWIELQYTDPNAFVVIEWGAFDPTTERAQPYPFEVSSEDALNFGMFNNVISWLVARSMVEKGKGINAKPKYRYTGYNEQLAVVFEPSSDERLSALVPDGQMKRLEFGVDVIDVYKSKGGQLYVIYYPEPYELGYLPAFRVGYKRDMQTGGLTFVSPIDAATPLLMKTIKSVSEMDLSMSLHAFPQKLQYTKRCQNEDCYGGVLRDGGGKCKVCKGSGLDVQTSAQEIITLEMPRSKEELIELTNIIHYEYPPVEMLDFQDQYIKDLQAACKEAIYNSDIFSKEEVSQTATGKNISLQAVYDTLYPMALDYAAEWRFIVKTISDVTGLSEGLVYNYTFAKDFKMKGVDELYEDLTTVGTSGAGSFVKQAIEDDIARVMYAEDPEQLAKHFTKQHFNPFSGLTPEQTVMLINSNLVPLKQRLLWANYGWIFDQLERDVEGFYILNRDKQRAYIDAKLDTLAAAMPQAQPVTMFQ